MFSTLKNAWKVPDLKRKLLFTLLIVVLYRLGCAIPIPYMSKAALESASVFSTGIFQYLNILTGSAISQATLFALGINPYITASIVMQLLTIAIPYLENLAKEGEEGQKKINQYTRYVTVVLGLITAIGYYQLLKSQNIITDTTFFPALVIITCYCAGSALVMWLAEKVNENGIGNGISMILFANIISRLPSFGNTIVQLVMGRQSITLGETTHIIPFWLGIIITILAIALAVAMIGFIVWMTNSERRIPIQYAKKVVGRKMYGGQSSNLPLKVNMVGVMPIIFASSICSIIPTIQAFTRPAEGSFWDKFCDFFGTGSWFYALLTFVFIIAFAYFYTSISFNPVEISNNLKTQGGSIPGIRPGRPTAEYITRILNRITLIGALLLAVVAVLPMIINICTGGSLSALAFGGSSIIIVVGVVLETIREIEAQMTMRHYKGFLG
ncbi:MAG: preprotein translocase subunit SecY [Ruminococcaceae bacterium]|nr:preprotein translocase subunit SecY [Oscillospiraceae bacterium]